MAVVTLILRFVVGAVFLLSGSIKVLDPGRFLIDVLAFDAVPYALAYVTALTLPWLEVLCAIALWTGWAMRGAIVWLMLMTAAFIVLIARAAAAGLDLGCGCFGDWLVFPNVGVHLAFNGVLLTALIWIWVAGRPKPTRDPRLRESLQRVLLEKR